ncbi:MAG: NF038143 family protein [Deltaproteobacteria bacterium]|nr:NF038143 family protein [Deltaproteobacteria bacterium]
MLKKKFDLIYNHERSIGNSVALRVIQPKPIGVWEFLIPIVFILHFMRSKQSREIFIQNYMFTKRHALDAAFKMLKKGLSREDVISGVEDKTRALLTASETQGIYSETIRQQQMNEIDLLVNHYSKLLSAEGKDYDALTRNAYGSRQNCLKFYEQLKSAEKKVSDAARQTLGSKADVESLLRIEKATEEIRQ